MTYFHVLYVNKNANMYLMVCVFVYASVHIYLECVLLLFIPLDYVYILIYTADLSQQK